MGRHRKIARNSEILRLYAGGIRVKSIAEQMGMSEFSVSSVVQREKQAGRLSQDGKTILLPGMDPDHCRFCGNECAEPECRGCRRMWREIHVLTPSRIKARKAYVGSLARPENLTAVLAPCIDRISAIESIRAW